MNPLLRHFCVFLAALAIPLVPFLLVGELPGDRWLSAQDANAAAFAATGVALLTADVVLPVPSSVMGVLLAARLGPAWGFASALLGLMGGSWLGFAMGRFSAARAGLPAGRSVPGIALVVTRPVPVLAEAVAISAGATGTPQGRFLIASLLGNSVYAAALAGAGSGALEGFSLGLTLGALGLLSGMGWLASRAWIG